MIIKLTESVLFTEDPAVRFAEQYKVKPKLFHELYRRYGLEAYDTDGLCGYFLYKTNKRLDRRALRRWLFRTEIYGRAQHASRMGVRAVDSSYFGEYERELLDELLKNIRFQKKRDSRTIL